MSKTAKHRKWIMSSDTACMIGASRKSLHTARPQNEQQTDRRKQSDLAAHIVVDSVGVDLAVWSPSV